LNGLGVQRNFHLPHRLRQHSQPKQSKREHAACAQAPLKLKYYVLHVIHMKKKELFAIRGIEEETYVKFREKAVSKRLRVGEALTLAMKEWLEKEEKREKVNPSNLLKIKPFDWGPGTERTSEEIDEILYGGKR